jgi:ubiquitin
MSVVSINSESTLAQVKAAYYDNCTYDVDGSLQEAQTFVAACRQLLIRIPKQVGHGNRAEEVEIDPTVIERAMNACLRWIYGQSTAAAGPITRVFSRGEPFLPTYPGPYYG